MGDFHEEEQALEKEALEAILMDDLTVLSDAVPRKYCVRIVPFPNGEGENHVGVKATFDIPPTYPDVPAAVTIEAEKGLSSSQTTELTAFAGGKALENVGMAMVYTLVDLVREWLAERNLAGQDGSMHAEMLKRVYMKEKEQQREKDAAAAKVRAAAIASGQDEEDELNRQKKLEGTAVTADSFIAWRDKFEAEMAESQRGSAAARAAAAAAAAALLKPTGKEMFMRNLAGTEEAAEEAAQYDEEEEAAAAARGVTVNDALFADSDGSDSDFELDSEDEEDSDDENDDDDDSDFGSDDESDGSGGGGGGKGKGKKGGGKGKGDKRR